eukprot:COSAG05_NODE_5233_length_1230_cov_0.961981_2_plen_212_part_01
MELTSSPSLARVSQGPLPYCSPVEWGSPAIPQHRGRYCGYNWRDMWEQVRISRERGIVLAPVDLTGPHQAPGEYKAALRGREVELTRREHAVAAAERRLWHEQKELRRSHLRLEEQAQQLPSPSPAPPPSPPPHAEKLEPRASEAVLQSQLSETLAQDTQARDDVKQHQVLMMYLPIGRLKHKNGRAFWVTDNADGIPILNWAKPRTIQGDP